MRKKQYESIHVRLDTETHKLLKQYSEKDHRNISDTVRMLIDKWLEEKGAKG
jgi:predicted DNA-binding protein